MIRDTGRNMYTTRVTPVTPGEAVPQREGNNEPAARHVRGFNER